MVNFLIAKGADINTRNNDGRTPLMMALAGDKQDVVKFLKQRGAKE